MITRAQKIAKQTELLFGTSQFFSPELAAHYFLSQCTCDFTGVLKINSLTKIYFTPVGKANSVLSLAQTVQEGQIETRGVL